MKRISSLQGFTVLEAMITLAIIGILAAIAIPNFLNQREKAKISIAITDIKNISQKVLDFYDDQKAFPLTLAEVGLGEVRDPWGNAYEYWHITGNKNLPRSRHHQTKGNSRGERRPGEG